MLTIDITRGVQYLNQMFPAKGMNIPNTILIYLNAWFDDYRMLLHEKSFRASFTAMVLACKDHDDTSLNLLLKHDAIMHRLQKLFPDHTATA